MKKVFIVAIIFVFVIFNVVACSKDSDQSNNNENKNFNNQNTKFETLSLQSVPVAPDIGEQPQILESYTDNLYNYYLLDAGYIENVYVSTLASVNYVGVPISFSKTTTQASEIQNSITEAVSNSYYFSIGTGGEINIGAHLGTPNNYFSCNLSLDWNIQGSITSTKSVSDTFSSANLYSESQTISYNFGANETDNGWYRYALYGTIDVYFICVTDRANQKLISMEVQVCAREDDYFVRSEYSENGNFDNSPNQEIVFEEDFYKYLDFPTDIRPVAMEPETKYFSTTPLSCKLDNKYNYTQSDPNANNKHFSHNFEFGKFVVSGGKYTKEGDFLLVQDNTIKVSFRLEYDANNLPLQDTMTSRYVSNDSKQSGFYKLPWDVGERTVGRGMIVALVSYYDDTPSERICITDAFNGKKAGQQINIASNIDKPCSISIAICYELEMWAPGFLGISDNYWMNWRINQSFDIVTFQ